jgi:hypothetical protein
MDTAMRKEYGGRILFILRVLIRQLIIINLIKRKGMDTDRLVSYSELSKVCPYCKKELAWHERDNVIEPWDKLGLHRIEDCKKNMEERREKKEMRKYETVIERCLGCGNLYQECNCFLDGENKCLELNIDVTGFIIEERFPPNCPLKKVEDG